MNKNLDYETIVRYAWMSYDSSRIISKIVDISAKVSTNHVFRVTLKDRSMIIAKVSFFGTFEAFSEDHQIIQALGNNLPIPHERLLARSLMKGNKLFIHRVQNEDMDAWVVFYLPIKIRQKLPKILSEHEIICLAKEIAHLHKSCTTIRNTLPQSKKTLRSEMLDLIDYFTHQKKEPLITEYKDKILAHCNSFLTISKALHVDDLPSIPIFVDWNIGNFSVNGTKLFSRWDYDWFRMSTRMMDFYFLSRVVSSRGDRTVFTYDIEPLIGDRFIRFLHVYNLHFPITRADILLLKECYRFFLLNYVLRHGQYFFSTNFATKLQQEVLEMHLDKIDQYDFNELADKVLI